MKTIKGVIGIILLGIAIYISHLICMRAEISGCRKTFLTLIESQQPIYEEDLKRLNPLIEQQCQKIIRSSY